MSHILLFSLCILFQLGLLAQHPQNKDSVWIQENRIKSITFYEEDRTFYYTFDQGGHLLRVLYTDSMDFEMYSCNFGEFEYTEESCYNIHTIRKNEYDSLHRITSEFYRAMHEPDFPALTGKMDSLIYTYQYEDQVRIQNYKWYESSYYFPETRLVHESNERTYFTAAGADSLIVTRDPAYAPNDTSLIVQFYYENGKLVSCNSYSSKYGHKVSFYPFLFRSQEYDYYPNGALRSRTDSEFEREDKTGNTVSIIFFTEDGYVKAVSYSDFDEETNQMHTRKLDYQEEQIYQELFCYRIEAVFENNGCVDITYYD